MTNKHSDLLANIRTALADPKAPWYGSDIVSWVGDLIDEVELWRWMTEMRLTVVENAILHCPPWAVLDVDDDVLAHGDTPIDAIRKAKADWSRWQ